ncbi:MAG: TerB family tellurite resistance protein [Spirochaetales bacterium]|nr:TerB family tellurite resistance protein [Spirochaetales bacterium]
MGWYGKLIGGAIGFTFLGGPFGAILGAAIGHSFDRRADMQDPSGRSSYSGNQSSWQSSGTGGFTTGDQAQMIFFVAAFSMMGKMANADGAVTGAEIRAIEDFIDRDLHLGIQEKQFAMRIVKTAAESSESFEKFAQQFYAQFHNQPQMLSTMFDILLKVSTADNVLSPQEEALLNSAARIFNLSDTQYERQKTKYYSNTDKYYSVLGCARTDSTDTIKSSYKKLVKDYHPDVIAAKGLPEEFTRFATEKFREINQAYEEIRKERNF